MTYKWEAMVEDLTVERDRLLKAAEALSAQLHREEHRGLEFLASTDRAWQELALAIVASRAALNEKTE